MTNFDLCENIFSVLHALQVDTVVVCAGARNAALVMNLETQTFKKIFYFEERSSAFFALGLIKQSGRPVAIITTSGTAAAEVLPATIEAYYQGLPLILITADRPKSYRGSGAPQTILQPGLYSHYVEQTLDWDAQQTEFNLNTSLNKPIHFNLCFDEPLLDKSSGKINSAKIKIDSAVGLPVASETDFARIEKPLVIVGELDKNQKSAILDFLKTLRAPIYLESLSQLTDETQLDEFVIHSSETLVKDIFTAGVCRSVIRIGGIPTLRFWRDLETQFKNVPVFNFTKLPFSGLAKPSSVFQVNFEKAPVFSFDDGIQPFKKKDHQLQRLKVDLFKSFPMSEPSCVHALSKIVENNPIYLGNSLPIREWDLFATSTKNGDRTIYANRGANGIDGQISTFLGWSYASNFSWCLIGDLTAMYDLAALGLVAENNKKNKKRLVVMNNFGGQIFNRVFKNRQFVNPHTIEFAALANMWSWDYLKIKTESDFEKLAKLSSPHVLVEIQPNALQTQSYWDAWDLACQKI